MNKNQKTLKDTFIEAVKNYTKGDFKNSEILCSKIISIDPNNFEPYVLLSNIYARKTDYKSAKKYLIKANDLKPNDIKILNNLGTACKSLKESEAAINYYNKVIAIDANNTNAHYNIGLLLYEMKNLSKAKNFLQKATELQPNFALAFFALGNIYVDLKNYEKAISSYQKAIEINPNLVGAHNNLGLVYRISDDLENAISCYEKAIKLKPNSSGTYHNMALAFKELGKFKESINAHKMAIKHEPENSINYYYLSELKKDILNEDLRLKIEKITYNKKSSKSNLAYANYLLAKYEKNLKNYEKELSYLIQGHKYFFDSKRDKFKLGVKYCFEDVIKISNEVKVKKSLKKEENKIKPIFIIGVPRCGSTLIEKVIGSGTKFIPLGEETTVFENFINSKILEKQSLNLGDADNIRNELINNYKKRGLISEKFDYKFTDKSLNNFFYLELIKDIFPNAKIINCKRNVLSSIVSILQNNLSELSWAHDISNIFKYFENYFNIIENFKETYPNYIHEIELEKFVNEPETESKSLLEYCELPWDSKCLEFYKRKDLISKTASNTQIREAIFKHNLEKYLPYKKYLKKYGEKYSWFN